MAKYYAGLSSAPPIAALAYQPGITVGPVGSGAMFITPGGAGDSTIIQAALAAAFASSSKTLYWLAGTYFLNTQLDIPGPMNNYGVGQGKTILMMMSTFPFSTANHALGFIGVMSGTDLVLAQDSTINTTTIILTPGTDISGVSINDLLHLRSEDSFNPTINTTRKRGEWVKATRLGADKNGITGSITAYNSTTKFQTFSGSGFDAGIVGKTLTIQNANNAANNGTFLIAAFIDANTIQLYNPTSGAGSSDTNNGSLHWVGPTISIYGMVRDQYLVSATARLRKVVLAEGFDTRGIEIRQQPAFGTIPTGGSPGFSFRGCKDIICRDLHVNNNEGPALVIEGVYGGMIDNVTSENLYDFSTAGDYGYHTLVGDTSEKIRITNGAADVCRHSVDTGRLRSANGPLTGYGVPRDVLVSGNQVVHATDAAFSSHEQGDGVAYIANMVGNSDNVGFFMRSLGAAVLCNVIRWASGGISIGSAAASAPSYQGDGSHVAFNSMRNIPNTRSASADFAGTGAGGGQGNGCGLILSRVDHVALIWNIVDGAGRAGIRLRKGTTRAYISKNVTFDANRDVSGTSTGSGITIDTPRTGTVTGTSISGTTVTATSSGWNPADIGSQIKTTGFGNAANNGVFTITATSSTTVSWTNPAGVAGDSGNYEDGSSNFNYIDGNFVYNRPFTSTDGPCVDDRTWIAGAAEYIFRNSGTTASTNTITNNGGVRLISGNQVDLSVAYPSAAPVILADYLASNINAKPQEDDSYTWIDNDQVANQTNTTNTYATAGFTISLDLSKYPLTKGNKTRKVYFVSILSSLGGNTVDSRVLNVTSGLSVGASTASTTSLTPAKLRVGPLTTNLTEGPETYNIQFRRGGVAETATYYKGRLEIAYE